MSRVYEALKKAESQRAGAELRIAEPASIAEAAVSPPAKEMPVSNGAASRVDMFKPDDAYFDARARVVALGACGYASDRSPRTDCWSLASANTQWLLNISMCLAERCKTGRLEMKNGFSPSRAR